MWSFRTIFLLAALGFLGGCGFQPLYGKSFAAYAPEEFAAIRVKPIQDRIGQQLHNHLLSFLDHAEAEGFVRAAHRAMLLVSKKPGDLIRRFESYVPPTIDKWT